ncbi:IS1182 family transposase [Polyangium mundeleinium]|uniref:IS1182 family transposase n=1 Tax=Polyangium mundeleinium TaxID=2995306 RepID=A0ABT5EF43_9BACT|nr:IS1182 family transposase [Polyangium mundeleinium]MDC0740435.1 IS1182 family transposase [Polyangium mundeleinium]
MLDRLGKRRRLFAFLRLHGAELFDEAFQAELAGMYRDTGEGKAPVPPALVCMVLLLQAYTGASDAEAIDSMVDDRRWQLVLGMLGAKKPAFAQGTLPSFRQRLIRHDMDLRLLERTVELAKKTKAFDWKQLPKTLRLGVDSRPLVGAGRVEDTFNLLGHAAAKLLSATAMVLGRKAEEIAACAGASVFLAPSIKAGLDIDWTDPEQKADAIGELVRQIDALEAWIRAQAGKAAEEPPLKDLLELIAQLRKQDLDPEPPDGGKPRIRKGVAEDRRVSIEDPDIRHGRKSKSKRFNGYKQHIAADLDTELILACAVTPANRPEGEGAVDLQEDLARSPRQEAIGEVFVDRAYVNSELVEASMENGATVFCKPWNATNGELFKKTDFKLNFRLRTITCPAGQTKGFSPGETVEFDPAKCSVCPLRSRCTRASNDAGRTVRIAPDEQKQQRFRRLVRTTKGREALRQRVGVEHRLAHLASKQGQRARFRGLRKNLFDLRRHAVVLNLETILRHSGLAKAA